MQAEAHFQDLARSIVHVVSADTKRSLRRSSRALWWWKAPSHLMPQFGTSLLFMWSGEAGNRQSPAQFTVRYPTLGSSKNNGENMHPRHGWQEAAPQKRHKVVLHHFTHLKGSTSQFFISHSTLGSSSCSSARRTSMAVKVCKRCRARQVAPVQVHCVPYSDAETCSEPGSDPANTHDCWIIPPNPIEQLWGVRGEDEEIKHAINVCRIKLNYL